MDFSDDTKRMFADRMQENQKENRREVWRTIETLRTSSPGGELHEAAHVNLMSSLRVWTMDVTAWAEKRAEEDPAVRALWCEVDLAPGVTGLAEFAEPDTFDDRELADVETLKTVARAMGNLMTVWLDFPPREPVVEDRWTPDERPDLDDLLGDLPDEVAE